MAYRKDSIVGQELRNVLSTATTSTASKIINCGEKVSKKDLSIGEKTKEHRKKAQISQWILGELEC